ncbi:MAG: hypothetical protein SFV22_19495 [Saprospiraceae bacterium]|nr:hypothetical protein [Saprospiraceae bacterium]
MKFKHISLLTLLALALAWAGCKKDDNPDEEEPAVQLIVPGEGLSDLKIGAAAQVAIDLYGTAVPSFGAANGIYYHFLIYASKGVAIYLEPTTEATFNAQMKIQSLTLSSPFASKTDKGIGIGSTKAEVKAAYGDPQTSSPNFGDTYNIGITFVYDLSDKVASIEVE